MKQPCVSFITILAICIGLSLLQAGFGQESATLEVKEFAICTDIQNRICLNPKEEFSMPLDRLFCFTRITGAAEDTEITHVWYYGDIERARIPLAVRTASYRTFSSKKIQAHETGKWRVEVLGPDGAVLKTIAFTVVQ